MSDYFRIIRGLEIDEIVRVIQGSNPPGFTADTDSSLIGSLYLDNLNGDLYIKYLNGTGPTKWRLATSAGNVLQLYDEKIVTPVAPSALGNDGVAIGNGATVASNASRGIAMGYQALTRHPNSFVQSGGRFASTGDAQAGTYLLRGHTVNAAETEIFLDGTGGTQRLVMPDDSTWTFTATITGHRTDTGDGHAGYKIEGVIYRQSGAVTTTMLGNPSVSVLSETNRQWEVRVYADTVAGALTFTCIGQSGKTIRWLAKVETVEVTN